jgi:RimJ/RimL family protein N-acetyltransferase
MQREGKLIRLRPVAAEDGERMQRWLADAEIARLYDHPYPRSLTAATAAVRAEALDSYADARFGVDTRDGRHIGYVHLFDTVPEERSAQLGVLIGEREFWSKGYGSEAVRMLLRFGFGEMNLHRIWLQVWAFNKRAIAAYRKLGFVEEARLREDMFAAGEYHDLVVMGMLEDEHAARTEAGA